MPADFLHLPRIILWAWQVPENMEFIDPRQVAVAYLDQTVMVRDSVATEPRFQPLRLPPATQVIAVVRVEMPSRSGLPSDTNREALVQALLQSARHPGVAALQVDFDVTRSQRPFYRATLQELRRRMPPGMPLSITALASWCAHDRWIAGLPVSEAVPMLFRMGRDGAYFTRRGPAESLREPLCSGSLGVSLDEPWPAHVQGKRLYVFEKHSWTPEAVAHTLERASQ
ncbi:MAG: DUF3142 domain-containing protein [Acidobacteriia bacterium]|nr:DUF3142 domain-containing protein [Terriglobia bacterium]